LLDKTESIQKAISQLNERLSIANREMDAQRSNGNHNLLCKSWKEIDEIETVVQKLKAKVGKAEQLKGRENLVK